MSFSGLRSPPSPSPSMRAFPRTPGSPRLVAPALGSPAPHLLHQHRHQQALGSPAPAQPLGPGPLFHFHTPPASPAIGATFAAASSSASSSPTVSPAVHRSAVPSPVHRAAFNSPNYLNQGPAVHHGAALLPLLGAPALGQLNHNGGHHVINASIHAAAAAAAAAAPPAQLPQGNGFFLMPMPAIFEVPALQPEPLDAAAPLLAPAALAADVAPAPPPAAAPAPALAANAGPAPAGAAQHAMAMLVQAHNAVQVAMQAIEAAQAAVQPHAAGGDAAPAPMPAPFAAAAIHLHVHAGPLHVAPPEQAVAAQQEAPVMAPVAAAMAAAVAAAPAAGAGVNNRRERVRTPEQDMELATWEVDDASVGKVLCKPKQVFLKSISSVTPAAIVFHNNTDVVAQAHWINYNGNEIAYSTIKPGEKKRYRTFASHPWVMRNHETGERLLLDSCLACHAKGEDEQVLEITKVPLLKYSFDTHSAFPKSFKAETKALLLSYQRLVRPELQTVKPCKHGSNSPTASGDAVPMSPKHGLVGALRRALCSVILPNSPSEAVAAEAPSSVTPVPQPLLGLAELPAHLVHHIITMMAPTDVKQDPALGPKGHPNVKPIQLPSDPATWPAAAPALA